MTTAPHGDALDEPLDAPATRGRARKYTQLLAVIHRAAVEVFASDGLAGASTQAIADKAGLSKAQLHYYIESKEALYRQVLQGIIDDWIGVFGFSDEAFGPRKVLSDLIHRKMVFSFEHPLRSRIFTAEMMRGAPVLRPMMDHSQQRTDQAAAVIQNWIDQGLMDPVDPILFLFHLWAVTQFYADHATQVALFRKVAESDDKDRRYLIEQVTEFLLKGAGVR
ncbi:TetR family transcriptional regulator C-terminal domain-containing protein [Variovorax sp. J31P179]|uniref:TetR family transcriptional regulator C-terminal domain-containing protein n=1 Tax=Variovorax sp. J31P179 TaxID=3053508 RepID=UPI0025752C85|nr:TetR family transcriptional regulator C-terminal domain-containing protein [Variovorax sp. J31P179]MDM0081379.1 TetR family transcriptional regulator C-terminal domain-containing protein [Variovorax sp. J31P179]HET7838029.1 TetR family transcriptional regulator C-terminal domain-containing protein [Variovorax sp.]